jgi:hypothetical protein
MIAKHLSDYSAIEAHEMPKVGEPVSFDLYVNLPSAGRFIRYICAGDVWDLRKKEMLERHKDPALYKDLHGAMASSLVDPDSLDTLVSDEDERIEPLVLPLEAPPDIQVFNDTVQDELQAIFRFVGDPDAADPVQTIEAMENLSKKIIEVVAPDVEDLRGSILEQSKYLMVMNDSAAITSVSVLTAMAHGFDSRKVFRDLSMAILMMDAPLADINEETVMKYYRDRSSLSPEEWEEMRRHPAKAHEVISSRLKNVSDTVLQLVLNHHELYNGKGYPRQIRSEQLPPIVRSLSLAVEVFEVMKREHLAGREIDILGALNELRELDVEAHLRRHNQKLVQSAASFIQSHFPSGAKPSE